MQRRTVPVRLIAMTAVTLTALALGGCGRKAGLDAPPGGLADQGRTPEQANTSSLRSQVMGDTAPAQQKPKPSQSQAAAEQKPSEQKIAEEARQPDGRFAAGTQPRYKSFFLDWMIK